MKTVYIVAAARSPIASVRRGKGDDEKNTSLISILSPEELSSQVLNTLFSRVSLGKDEIDIFRMGSLVSQKAEVGFFHAPAKSVLRRGTKNKNLANAATFEAACATGLVAIEDAFEEIALGRADIAVVGGVEMMSRHHDSVIQAVLRSPETGEMMWHLADKKARALGLTREELDRYSFESSDFAKLHKDDHGSYIVPISVPGREAPLLATDEGSSRSLSLELIRKLPPLAGCELITAAHSSKYGDGAAFLVLASEEAVRSRNLCPLARILSIESWSEDDPSDFIVAPNSAIPKALKSASLPIESIETFIVNEAFAPSPVSFMKEFGISREKINPWGGAIAFGHPFGATGAILLVMLLTILDKENLRYGALGICAAGGEASACVIEMIR